MLTFELKSVGMWKLPGCAALPAQLLALFILTACMGNSSGKAWLLDRRPDISSRAKCRAASGGHVWRGDSITDHLQTFLTAHGPGLHLPDTMTDITTATTIMQLAAPDIKVVLDPLLYLQMLPKSNNVPPIIHMTMKDKHQLAPHQILSMLSWGRYNKGYAILLYDDTDIEAYMQHYYPSFMLTFHQLKTPVEKSDAWRYHVLCGHGGIYTDTDTVCVKPFDQWVDVNTTQGPGLIVGIENRFYSQQEAEEASYVHKIQVTQWTIASKMLHPVVCGMGDAIQAFMAREAEDNYTMEQRMGHDASILLRTGPGIWSTEMHKYIQQMGGKPEDVVNGAQVADLLVLPQTAFGCNFRYWNMENVEPLVYHLYNNSWKVDHFKVADAKKWQRRQKQMQATVRAIYPTLVVVSSCCGILAAVYAGMCLLPGNARARRAKLKQMQLQSIVVSSRSARQSPTVLPSICASEAAKCK